MEAKFYLNDKEDSELTDKIYQLIENAKSYIKTGNFFFKDTKLEQALIKASDRGIAIFFFFYITGSKDRGQKMLDIKEETDPHMPNLIELYKHGIHVNIINELHAKFIICDGEQGLIMSANYTSDSLYNNSEAGVDVLGEELKDLEYIFDVLYQNKDIKLSEEGHMYRYTKVYRPISPSVFENIGKNSNLLLTAGSRESNNNLKECNYQMIYDEIVDTVQTSKEYLIIMSWSYNEIQKLKELQDEVKKAIKRGVKIKLIYSSKGPERSVFRTQNQIPLLIGEDLARTNSFELRANHAKCIISESKGIMFTANIDGKKGLLTGFELGCVLTEDQREKAYNRINQIIENGK